MKHETKLHALFLIFPCFLSAIFASIYSWKIWPSYQLVTVNILCVFFVALDLAQAFTERVNAWKVCGFVGSSAICGIATELNIFESIQGEVFSLQKLSFWSWLWIGLLALSVISLMIILVRMFRWDQKQWEEMRKWRQEYRKEQMEARRKRRGSKQEEKQKVLEEKADIKLRKQRDRADKEGKNQKHEQQLDRLKEWKKYWESTVVSMKKGAKSLGAGVVVAVMAGLFLAIPYSKNLQDIAFKWFDAVGKLASSIDIFPKQSQSGFFQSFANYVIFYIFLIVTIWFVAFLCQYVYGIFTSSKKGERAADNVKARNLLAEYDTAIAVLTVFTAVMFAFGNSGSPFNGLTGKWTILITVILFILIVFVSVEVVRLVIEQIGQKNSLLKRLIRLIFIAILEFLVGLLLGVIISFEIEKTVSSLLSMMFPQEELSFKNRIQEKFNEMFSQELGDDLDNGGSELTNFSRKHVWRRYKK